MYDIENYWKDDLKVEVSKMMSKEKLASTPAFTKYILDEIHEKTNVDEYETIHCEIKDKANRVKGEIYGRGLSANKEVLTLYYAIYDPTQDEIGKLKDGDFQTAMNRLQGFYDQAIRGNHIDIDPDKPEYSELKYIYDNLSTIVSVRLCLISNCFIKDYKIKNQRIDDKNILMDVWDIEKICANLVSESDHVSINIDFEGEQRYSIYKLPYIEMNSERYGYKCLSTMFPAKLLYKLYEDYNTDLLMNNVRFFLGFSQKKDDTNNGMRKTLKESNEMFLAYNNGITAIARDIEVESNKDKTKLENEVGSADDFISTGIIKKIIDFQIVNGGQTTASIFNAKRTDKKEVNLLGVYVMVNDPLYWFYERVRGQYKIEQNKRNKAGQESFKKMYPSDRKFDKEIIAKLWLSWYGSPHEAVKGSSTTYAKFLEVIDDGNYAPDETYYKRTIALLVIYKYLLQHGKEAEYSNATAPAAAYTLSYLNEVTQNNLDLIKIWQMQELTDEFKTFLDDLSDKVKNELDLYATSEKKSVLSISKTKPIYPKILKKDWWWDIDSIRYLMTE